PSWACLPPTARPRRLGPGSTRPPPTSIRRARFSTSTPSTPTPATCSGGQAELPDGGFANAGDLLRRAGGTPIRVASKSVRCRAVLRRVLSRPGFAGVLAYSLAEALWLAEGEDPVS